MNELDTLRAFFRAWDDLQAMPVNKGRPSQELTAARELLDMRANAVRTWRPDGAAPVVAAQSAEAAALRAFQKQVAEIPPKDTRTSER